MTSLKIQRDGNDAPYIEWEQRPGGIKRAWVQRKDTTSDKNWADVPDGRYLNVVRCTEWGRTGGNATDFPIFSELPDEQILVAFVTSVSAITGCQIHQRAD